MSCARTLTRSICLLLLCLGIREKAFASSITQTGTFTADNQVAELSFAVSSASTYTLYTTSYGGGANLDGTTSLAGGFLPNLTLFSSTSGTVLGTDGAGGLALGCRGSAVADAGTGMCDDAYLQLVLAPGNYLLALTEFPNVAVGSLADGFLLANNPNATGTACGVAGGTFLASDTAPCTQRDGNYAVNLTNASAVPEPSTWVLVLPAAGALFFVGRQHLS